jgi:hypothetical protein
MFSTQLYIKSIKHRTEDVSDIKLTQTAIKFVREFVVIKKIFFRKTFSTYSIYAIIWN